MIDVQAVIRPMSMVMCMGTQEYEDATQSMSAWQTDEQSLYQSAIASVLYRNDSSDTGKRVN